jgi:hypothetical protein
MSDLRVEIMRAHQDVANSVPGAKNRLENLQAKFRTSGAMIERVGGSCSLIERGAGAATISPPRTGKKRASWQLGDKEELSYRDVKLVERGYADFAVDLGSGARETILGEIRQAHREVGDVEVAGWLFSQGSLRHDSRSLTIAYATLGGRGNARTVSLGDPLDGIAAARSAGIDEHWKLCGDWHRHPRGGSELPSHQDAKAWAGTADWLARSCYVSLIVSPSENLGWMSPKLSAWVARRYGSPSGPVVQRARMEW